MANVRLCRLLPHRAVVIALQKPYIQAVARGQARSFCAASNQLFAINDLRETTTPRTGWLREISREIGPKKCFQKRSPSRQTRISRETPPSASRGRTTTCTARAAKPTTHVYICCQFSSIRCSGFASGLSNDFSPSAQTLLANAPSLVPFQGATLVKWPSEIPTLFQYVKPTI